MKQILNFSDKIEMILKFGSIILFLLFFFSIEYCENIMSNIKFAKKKKKKNCHVAIYDETQGYTARR